MEFRARSVYNRGVKAFLSIVSALVVALVLMCGLAYLLPMAWAGISSPVVWIVAAVVVVAVVFLERRGSSPVLFWTVAGIMAIDYVFGLAFICSLFGPYRLPYVLPVVLLIGLPAAWFTGTSESEVLATRRA